MSRRPTPTLLLCLLLGLPPAGAAQGNARVYRPIPKPSLTIGAEGDPDYEFVRIQTAVRTRSGPIAVVDGGTPEIRIYDGTGRLLRKLGGNGAGPGEFRRIGRLLVAGDTLISYDGSLRRLTWYAIDGTLLQTVQVQYPRDEGHLVIDGRLASGRWMVTTAHSPSWNSGPGVYRDTTRVGTLPQSASGPVTWYGAFPGMTFFVHNPPGRQSEWAVGPLPFSPYPFFAVWQDSILVGDVAGTAVGYYSSEGRQARVLTLPNPDTVRTLAAARAEALAGARTDRDRAYVRLSYDAAEKARDTQLWGGVVIADDGALWLSLAEPRPDAGRRYLVVAPGGRVLAAWLLPPRSRVLSVRGTELLAAMRDADDVERVALIRLPAVP